MLLLTLELSSIILINRNGTELKFFLCSMGFCGMPETCLGLAWSKLSEIIEPHAEFS